MATKAEIDAMRRGEDQRLATAYHEAGHAAAAYLELGVSAIHTVSIKPDLDDEGASLGRTIHDGFGFMPDGSDVSDLAEQEKLGRLVSHAVICLAGNQAEKMFGGRNNWVGARSDTEMFAQLALAVCGSHEEATAFAKWIAIRTAALISQPHVHHLISEIALALYQRETLTGDEVAEIAREAMLTSTEEVAEA